MGISGAAIEEVTTAQVIAAWIVAQRTVSASNSGSWVSLGDFQVPAEAEDVCIEAIHMVSAAGLSSELRIRDNQTGAFLPGTVSTSLTREKTRGLAFVLAGGRSYQLQARCVGSPGAGRFSLICSATITN
jgi:hypothetical protein